MSTLDGEGREAPPRSLSDPLPEPREGIVIRHEEEVSSTGVSGWRGVGFLKARTRTHRAGVDEVVSRVVEKAALERLPVEEGDSQRIETLADGSISIPIFEEELVITKRVVLKERVVLRKHMETVTERVRDELRRERIEFEADEGVRDRVRIEQTPPES